MRSRRSSVVTRSIVPASGAGWAGRRPWPSSALAVPAGHRVRRAPAAGDGLQRVGTPAASRLPAPVALDPHPAVPVPRPARRDPHGVRRDLGSGMRVPGLRQGGEAAEPPEFPRVDALREHAGLGPGQVSRSGQPPGMSIGRSEREAEGQGHEAESRQQRLGAPHGRARTPVSHRPSPCQPGLSAGPGGLFYPRGLGWPPAGAPQAEAEGRWIGGWAGARRAPAAVGRGGGGDAAEQRSAIEASVAMAQVASRSEKDSATSLAARAANRSAIRSVSRPNGVGCPSSSLALMS